MKNRLSILLILFSIQLILSCGIRVDDSELKDSAVIETETPAFNKELIIDIEGDTIAGYPGNDNNFDVAQEIRRNGKNVIHFNHRGAWGSQGQYNYSNCLEDIEKVIEYFSAAPIAKKLKIDIDRSTLLGRSFGGGIALIKGSQIPSVKKIIAISSVNYGAIMNKYESLDELGGFKKYMKKQIMISTNFYRNY